MASIKAIVIKGEGDAQIENVTAPTLRPDYINVQTFAYAINPTDWRHIDMPEGATTGTRVGCDYAGTVLSVGSAVTKDFKPGDRVCGVCHGGNAVYPEDGAFAEICTAKGDLQILIPPNLSFEEAATLGVGITTIGQGLYQSLKLPLPNQPSKEKFPILIYGGSTATGSLAIQSAKLSGLEVITTCSPSNFQYVKNLGADKVFDYNSPTCAEDIKTHTKNGLRHVFDCISEDSSYPICIKAMSDKGGTYSTILFIEAEKIHALNENVETKMTMGYTICGEQFLYGDMDFPANQEDFEFGKMWWEMARGLLEEGRLRVHKQTVNQGGMGFEGALHGIGLVRDGKVSGTKLVYTAN